jgi:hypothetical protein
LATRRSYIDPAVEQAIVRYVDEGLTPSQIEKQLYREKSLCDNVPNLRSIQRRVKELSPPDASGPWDWRISDGANTEAILSVLSVVINLTQGRKTSFTNREAALVSKVHQAAPTLPDTLVYITVCDLLRRENQGRSIEDIDCWLAFRPWESLARFEQYAEAVGKGWIPSFVLLEPYMIAGLDLPDERSKAYQALGWKRVDLPAPTHVIRLGEKETQ